MKQRSPGLFVRVAVLLCLGATVAVGADALLVDHGGTVLSTPQVSAIYLGDFWATHQGASDALHTDAFLQAWLAGPSVTGVLAQYRVGAASVASSDKVPGASPLQFADDDAQALVQQEIAAGRVVTGDDTVHVVYLPAGTILTFQGVSSLGRLTGYHSSYRDTVTGKPVYYAVVVYNQGTNGIDFTGTPQDNLSIVTSRVLAGAFTNPDAGVGTPGWRDDLNGEVGDIAFVLSKDPALGDVWTLQNGFAVVLLWSNKDQRLDAGTVATATTPTGTSALSITPATQSATPGGSVTYTVTNAAGAMNTLALALSGLPAGATGTFAATTIAPGASTTLTVAVAADATLGTSATFTVTGADGAATQSSSATLTVGNAASTATPAAAAADFSMTVTPTSQEMIRGGTVAVFTITTEQVGGKVARLKLKTLHVRNGIKTYLSRTRLAAGETATLAVRAHRDARRRAYEFTLKASSDRADQRVTLTIVVK